MSIFLYFQIEAKSGLADNRRTDGAAMDDPHIRGWGRGGDRASTHYSVADAGEKTDRIAHLQVASTSNWNRPFRCFPTPRFV